MAKGGIKTFVASVGLVCSLCYLLLLPTGYLGLCAGVLILGTAICSLAEPAMVGAFLLIFGQKTFGYLFQLLHLPVPGSLMAVLAGIICIVWSGKLRNKTASSGLVLLWLAIICCVAAVSYLYGPRTVYSKTKLLYIVSYLCTCTVAFLAILENGKLDFSSFGIATILGGVALYAFSLNDQPIGRPENVFITGGTYNNLLKGEENNISTNYISYYTGLGVALALICINQKMRILKACLLLSSVMIGILNLNTNGQRLSIVATACAVIAGTAMFHGRRRPLFVIAMIITGLVLGLWIKLSIDRGDERYTVLVNPGEGDVTNRRINWDEARARIKEEFWIGHGLGGYYVSGYSAPGDGTYAHNMVLELLSEVGIIGTLIVLSPAVILVFSGIKDIRADQIKIILLSYLIVHAMGSFDLRDNVICLSLIAALSCLSNRRTPENVGTINKQHAYYLL